MKQQESYRIGIVTSTGKNQIVKLMASFIAVNKILRQPLIYPYKEKTENIKSTNIGHAQAHETLTHLGVLGSSS